MPQVPDVAAPVPRKRGRPPRAIEPDAVVDAVERLFADGGIDAVTIERTAAELGVSRATLYRTVPSKAQLLGLHFVRMTKELDRRVAHRPADSSQAKKRGRISPNRPHVRALIRRTR